MNLIEKNFDMTKENVRQIKIYIYSYTRFTFLRFTLMNNGLNRIIYNIIFNNKNKLTDPGEATLRSDSGKFWTGSGRNYLSPTGSDGA